MRWCNDGDSPPAVENSVLKIEPLHIQVDDKDTFIELEMCDLGPGTTHYKPLPPAIQRSTMLIQAYAKPPNNLQICITTDKTSYPYTERHDEFSY
jgi:hypothetical protein